MGRYAVGLTFARRVLPPWAADLPPETVEEERGATPLPVPTPTAGDIDRMGIFGGGPGSEPGERRCIGRDGPPMDCIVAVRTGLLLMLFRLYEQPRGCFSGVDCTVTCRIMQQPEQNQRRKGPAM